MNLTHTLAPPHVSPNLYPWVRVKKPFILDDLDHPVSAIQTRFMKKPGCNTF
jgi:hypothetical protein